MIYVGFAEDRNAWCVYKSDGSGTMAHLLYDCGQDKGQAVRLANNEKSAAPRRRWEECQEQEHMRKIRMQTVSKVYGGNTHHNRHTGIRLFINRVMFIFREVMAKSPLV